ncbi:calphotin-like isoform X1 [Arapaima gigas]
MNLIFLHPLPPGALEKAKTSVDVGQFLRTRVEFPKKEPWGVPESRAEAGAKYTAAFQATAFSADATPAVDPITHSVEPIVSTDTVAAEIKPESPPVGTTSQASVQDLVADEATPVVEAISEASEAPQQVIVARSEVATEAAQQVVTGEAAPEQAVTEADPRTVQEAPIPEAAPDEAAAEFIPDATSAEAIQEVPQYVATSDPISEVIPEATQDIATAEAVLESASEVAVADAVSEETPQAAVAEAPIAEDVPQTLQEATAAETTAEIILEIASDEVFVEAAPEVATTVTGPETTTAVQEVIPKIPPEPVTAATETIPEAMEAVSSEEMVDPTPVLAEAPGAVESPEAQVDPIQKLFIEKIREYSAKSKSSGGLVDAGPEYERNVADEVNRLQRLYGGGDLNNFPDFKFPEPKLEEVSK